MSEPIPLRFGEAHWPQPGLDATEIVLVPVPFDLTTSYGKGSDRGPEALLAATPNLEFYDIETGTEVYRRGIHVLDPVTGATSHEMLNATQQAVSTLLELGKFPVVLGGEHTVSVGAIRATAHRYPGLSLLHLDAHGDRRDSYLDNPFSHACAVARAKEAVTRVVSVGLRSIDASELDSLREDTVIYAHDIAGSREWIDPAVNALGPDVYVTIDLDVLDPSIMPATGTPEPGGLGWYDVTRLLKAVADRRHVVAFDIVELAPVPGCPASDFIAAKLLYTFLSYIFAPRP